MAMVTSKGHVGFEHASEHEGFEALKLESEPTGLNQSLRNAMSSTRLGGTLKKVEKWRPWSHGAPGQRVPQA